MTLTDFLLARIAEDEAVARSAATQWQDFHGDAGYPTHGLYLDMGGGDMDRLPGEHAAHIARHDPARVLAGCAAKRRIIAMSDGGADFEAAMPTRGYAQPYHSPSADVMTRTRQLLALPYGDHPDYDEAWRP